MGTITRRESRGRTVYRAEIRIKRGGRVLVNESRTFSRRALAATWMAKREAELAEAGDDTLPRGETVAGLIRRHFEAVDPIRRISGSKRAVLEKLMTYPIGDRRLPITSADVIEHCRDRVLAGASPATVSQDVTYLSGVWQTAPDLLRVPVDPECINRAKPTLRRLGLIASSAHRARRLEGDEEARLLDWFGREDGRAQIPMVPIFRFAIASCMRQGEIVRIAWADYDGASVIIHERKDPRRKADRHDRVPLTDEARALIEAQPRIDALIWPFKGDSIRARFERACRKLGIVGLTFHDLRREGASRLLERGWSLPEIARVTGHRSLDQLARYLSVDVGALSRTR